MSRHDKRVRHAVRDALKAAVPAVAGRVYTNRAAALDAVKLPAIVVWTPERADEESQAAPLEYKRSITLKIEVVARANPAPDDDADDIVDDIADEVEKWIATHDTLPDSDGNTAARVRMSGTTSDVQDGASHPLASQVLTFAVEYYQEMPSAEMQVFPPLAKVSAAWNVDGEGNTTASDEFSPPLK